MEKLQFPGAKLLDEKYLVEDDAIFYQEQFEIILNLTECSLLIFVVATLRTYEDALLKEPEKYKKKSKPIFELLKSRSKAPSLGTLLELARNCLHLINVHDDFVSDELLSMKEVLDKVFRLEDLAFVLRDLEQMLLKTIDENNETAKRIYRKTDNISLMKGLFPTLVEIRNKLKHQRDLNFIINEYKNELKLDKNEWKQGINKFIEKISVILNQKFIHKRIIHIASNENSFIEDSKENLEIKYKVREYNSDGFEEYFETFPIEDYVADNLFFIKMTKGSQEYFIELYPFLLLDDDKLKYYKKTSANGYEYFSFDNKITSIKTKRKFDHSVFKKGVGIGDTQKIFWSEVKPIVHPITKIKANIPIEGPNKFFGRKKQIKKIREEILEIPNVDGIIYGPGGVGKTALMREISIQLFTNFANSDELLFNNIVWASAKKDFYNPILNITEENNQQFECLEHILSVILKFFDYEDVDEYGFEDKKELLVEILLENKTLLVLDNFETISPTDAKQIINFFSIEIKKQLKRRPDSFKVILTSRESIPSGFQQFKLKGLDLKDSKNLMNNEYNKYKNIGSDLTDEQKENIHEYTHGIPILIKHVYGKLFEFKIPLVTILQKLPDVGNEVIKFSFKEILDILKKDDLTLDILLALSIYDYPLMIRQICDILNEINDKISSKLPQLLNYQCIETFHETTEQKYVINPEIDILIKSLQNEYSEKCNIIRQKINSNYTSYKQIDYSVEEQTIISIFSNQILNKNLRSAEEFISEQINKKPNSIILKYHYAEYLLNKRNDVEKARVILEEILKTHSKENNSMPHILKLLVDCYMSQSIPDFSSALKYVLELENSNDDSIKLFIAKFYIGWSTSIKKIGPYQDSIKDIERKCKYKELAQKGLNLLNELSTTSDHEVYFTKAQAFFNTWNNDNAITMINTAISLAQNEPNYLAIYIDLRKEIIKHIGKKNTYGFYKAK
jgi:hypothetical protein